MSSTFLLSKLKQSRMILYYFNSLFDASIIVSQRSIFRNCKNYNSEFATHTFFCNNITIIVVGPNKGHICDNLHCVLFASLINDVKLHVSLPHWSLANLATLVKCMLETGKRDSDNPNPLSSRRSGGGITMLTSHIGYGSFPKEIV